jgi:regulatory protein YycI of two-component signal transduction system YycFG
MGILDSILGGGKQKTSGTASSTSKSTTDTQLAKTEASQDVTAKQSTSQVEGAATQRGTQTQQTAQLTAEQLGTLDDLINRAATRETVYGAGSQDLGTMQKNIATFVSERLLNGGAADIDSIVQSAQNAAILNYEEGDLVNINQTIDSILGSQNNTTAQLLKEKGARNLATQLAAIEGDIRLKGADLQNQEAITAANVAGSALAGQQSLDLGSSQALNDALAALGIAKGATGVSTQDTLTSGVTSQRTTESELLDRLVRSLTGVQSTEETIGKTTGQQTGTTKDSGNILNLLELFSSSLNSGYGTPA